MGAQFTAYQAFLRRFLQDHAFQWETDCELVRRKITALVNRNFDARADGGATVVSSNIEGSAFTYRLDGRFDADSLIEYATRALALVESINPADQVPGWDDLGSDAKATYNRRAIQRLRNVLLRRRKSVQDFTAIPL